MKTVVKALNCNQHFSDTKRVHPFVVVEMVFDRNSKDDNDFLECVLTEAKDLAAKVNPNAASASDKQRSQSGVLANAISGILSERCWEHFINQRAKKDIVYRPDFSDISNQIDLETINNGLTIEVRSSYPRNGIEFAICHPKYQFDIIGSYTNSYKKAENFRDFYLRSLFPTINFISYFNADIVSVYLTGGATNQMMRDKNIYIEKNLKPEDNLDGLYSTYRVIPYHRALDTLQVTDLIINGEKNENSV